MIESQRSSAVRLNLVETDILLDLSRSPRNLHHSQHHSNVKHHHDRNSQSNVHHHHNHHSGAFSQLFDSEVEQDSSYAKLVMEQHRLIELARFVLIVTSIAFATISFEVNYFGEKTFLGMVLQHYMFSVTVIIEILTVLSCYASFKFGKVTNLIPSNQPFYRSSEFLHMSVQCIFLAFSPNPFSQDYRIFFSPKTNAFYTLNELFTFILYSRIFLAFFILLKLTSYYNSSATRVGKFYSVKWNTLMVFKIYFRDFPVQTQLSILCVALLYSTLMFWVSERPQARLIDQEDELYLSMSTFYNFQPSIYITYISFFGVGYGEISPDCDTGRLVQIFCCSMGTTTTSLMIVNLMNMLDPSPGEVRSMSVIDRIQLNSPIRKIGALIIDGWGFLHNKMRRTNKKDQKSKDQLYEHRYQLKHHQNALKHYKRIKNDIVGESVDDIIVNNMTFLRSTLIELIYINERIEHNLKQIFSYVIGQPLFSNLNIQKRHKYLGSMRRTNMKLKSTKLLSQVIIPDTDRPIYRQTGKHPIFQLVSQGQTKRPGYYGIKKF